MHRGLLLAMLLASACGDAGDGWVWHPVEDARCADGSSTGYGLRARDGDDLVIYLMGGGACWDFASCYGLQLAWNVITGYGKSSFGAEPRRTAGIFEAFPDATQVFVPYCTGDLHSGTEIREHSPGVKTQHVGAHNLDAILKRLTRPRGRVFVVGTSAGGYGAQLQAARFAEAFPDHEVHVMADSAAMVFSQEKIDTLTATWGATPRTELPASSRRGLVASKRDWLISIFAELDPAQVEERTLALPGTNLILDGNQHVFFDNPGLVGVKDYVEAWRDGTAPYEVP